MSAQLVLCGDPPVGVGGEFELECARELRDNLPDGFVIATNVHLPRGGGGEFYECDAVLSAPGVCDILEVKCIRPDAIVWEDLLSSETGFSIDRVFSKLDDKAKVLSSRRKESPFPSGAQHRSVWVRWQVVVPSNTRITFKVPMHAKSKSVLTLADTVQKYRSVAASSPIFPMPLLGTRISMAGWHTEISPVGGSAGPHSISVGSLFAGKYVDKTVSSSTLL